MCVYVCICVYLYMIYSELFRIFFLGEVVDALEWCIPKFSCLGGVLKGKRNGPIRAKSSSLTHLKCLRTPKNKKKSAERASKSKPATANMVLVLKDSKKPKHVRSCGLSWIILDDHLPRTHAALYPRFSMRHTFTYILVMNGGDFCVDLTYIFHTWFAYGCVWKCSVPYYPQWFCWSLSLWKMASYHWED